MKNILLRSCLVLIAVFVCASCSKHACAQGLEERENDSLVGRIAHIEGQLLRYVPDEDDWVLTEPDTPFGEYDNLFSSEDGKVEIIMPNNTVARIGGDTQVQLIELNNQLTEIDVSSGAARLYNKSSSVQLKATTPFGDVILPPGTVCDVFVHEEQAEIISLQGSLGFIKAGSTMRHELIAGSSSIIVNSEQIVASAHSVSLDWDNWNVDRDVQWAKRMQARGDSEKYLPESLQGHAYDLEENGSWERVQYDGAYRYFWRPTYVHEGWTPFSTGRWIMWHGEQTWVPSEPFGYVTHHYGNWVHVRNCWYWAPPVSTVMVSLGDVFLNIGMSWYPGRVAWLSSSVSIGWFPLAPYETYYSTRYWGPRCKVRRYNHYYKHNRHRYKHHRHARYIDHRHYYGSKNYRHAGLRKGHRDEKYRGSARFPEKLRKNHYAKTKHRYASTIPGFKNKVKRASVRKDKRYRQKTKAHITTNPFKNRIAKASVNKTGVEKKGFKNPTGRGVKNNIQIQKRPTLAKTKQVNTISKASTKRKQGGFNTSKRSYSQPSKKVVPTRKNLKTSSKSLTGKSVKKVARVKQDKKKAYVSKNPLAGTRVRSKSSRGSYQATRSNTTGRVVKSFVGSTRRQSSRQNTTARTQSYASRSRRW